MFPQGNSQISKKALSPRGRTTSRLPYPVARVSLFGTAAEGNIFSLLANAAEGKSDVDIDPSDDPTEPATAVPIGHGGTLAPTMAAIQQANPGGVFILLTHPNYSSFLKRHFIAPSGFRLPIYSFIWFRPPDGQLLSCGAAGLQTYVYSAVRDLSNAKFLLANGPAEGVPWYY